MLVTMVLWTWIVISIHVIYIPHGLKTEVYDAIKLLIPACYMIQYRSELVLCNHLLQV